MPRLFLAEKPSVAQMIAEAIGGASKTTTHWKTQTGDLVTWAIGHLLEYAEPQQYDPKYASWRYDDLPILPATFKVIPTHNGSNPKAAAQRLAAIEAAFNSGHITSVVNACDAGREGELIFRRIWDYLKLGKKGVPMERLWLSSMTPDGIRAAIKSRQPGKDYDNLAEAAKQRAQADWIIGMNGTRAATMCLRRPQTDDGKPTSWSIGRVQTPTLALIVDRDVQIARFTNLPYWCVAARFQVDGQKRDTYPGLWYNHNWKKDPSAPEKQKERVWSQDAANAIVQRVQGKPATIQDVIDQQKKLAPKLYDLTTLQKEANQTLGWTAAATLEIAQSLYETKKVITYPRTDSTALPADYPPECAAIIQKLSQQQWQHQTSLTLPVDQSPHYNRVFNNAEVTDHFAIIPTGEPLLGANEQESQLYRLIVLRFLAVFCPLCLIQFHKRTTIVTNPEQDHFNSELRTITAPGWQALYGIKTGAQSGSPLPGNPASSVLTMEANCEERQTEPPPHYTEATLLDVMSNISNRITDKELAKATEERGLGTPATRAAIIETLKQRAYITLGTKGKKKAVLATEKGIGLIEQLRTRGLQEITSAEMTGDWELKLKQIEKGIEPPSAFAQAIVAQTRTVVAKLPTAPGADSRRTAVPFTGQCPACNAPLVDDGQKVQCRNHNWKDQRSCWVVIWRTCCTHPFTDEEITRLLKGETLGPIDRLVGKSGKPFSAKLYLDRKEQRVQFLF